MWNTCVTTSMSTLSLLHFGENTLSNVSQQRKITCFCDCCYCYTKDECSSQGHGCCSKINSHGEENYWIKEKDGQQK